MDRLGSILLVGQEIVRPYHRPPLSKDYLRRQTPREKLFTHGQGWFEDNQIEFRSGRRAVHLDVTRGAVTLDQGETIGYDKLLLATGMAPRSLDVPGAHLPNLFYLRTLEDAHHLQTAIDKALHEGHRHPLPQGLPGVGKTGRGTAAVIGAGALGVELAASLTQLGISVDLLCSRAHPWDKFAGEIVGKALSFFLEQHGVRVHPLSRPARVEGDGRVQRVALQHADAIDCDFAVAAVGATAHRELLRGTPVAAESAILTDDHCRTNVPNIYAAGDCAALFDPLFGKHRIVDHWDQAAQTGKLAGRNMAGADEAFNTVSEFFSDIFELSLKGWGEPRLVERRLVRNIGSGNGSAPDMIEIGVAGDGRVAQVLTLGQHGDESLLRGLVARRARIDGLEEKLKDPSVPLAELLRHA
jgi:3-phenylpropionate/trans-cinnamate dioxygenase ferredoxin reductase subunit